ncbi:MAG: hypothetical protein E7591_01300 [Ruminococcaceae bacterium]|nr:hypothetical protein [Oscillospiraceae bacterium]
MKKKNNTLVTVIVVLGAIAAIALAATVIYKKYNKKLRKAKTDSFDFADDDFDADEFDDIFLSDDDQEELEF